MDGVVRNTGAELAAKGIRSGLCGIRGADKIPETFDGAESFNHTDEDGT